MNIGAYVIICGVGAALMIIGFWIGYAYRATHGPDPLTPEERAKILAAHLEAHRKFLLEPIKGRSYDYQIFDDVVNPLPSVDGIAEVKEIHDRMVRDIAAGHALPDPWTGAVRIDPPAEGSQGGEK